MANECHGDAKLAQVAVRMVCRRRRQTVWKATNAITIVTRNCNRVDGITHLVHAQYPPDNGECVISSPRWGIVRVGVLDEIAQVLPKLNLHPLLLIQPSRVGELARGIRIEILIGQKSFQDVETRSSFS